MEQIHNIDNNPLIYNSAEKNEKGVNQASDLT